MNDIMSYVCSSSILQINYIYIKILKLESSTEGFMRRAALHNITVEFFEIKKRNMSRI